MCSWCAKLWLCVVCVSAALAQGFDWVPTYMLPFRIPTTYAVAALRISGAGFRDSRAVEQGTLLCARYGSGSGAIITGAGGVEWWFAPDAALTAVGMVGWSTAQFRAAGTVAPLVTGETLQTEYVLSTSRAMLGVQAAVKKRVALSYGWVSVGVDVSVLLPAQSEQRERVVSPAWYTFATQPPSRQVLLGRSTAELSAQVGIVVAVGYDVALRHKLYCSPALEVVLPYTLNFGSVRLWRIGVVVPLAFSP